MGCGVVIRVGVGVLIYMRYGLVDLMWELYEGEKERDTP